MGTLVVAEPVECLKIGTSDRSQQVVALLANGITIA